MRIIYSIVLIFYQASIRMAALAGNRKAKLWVDGRRNWERRLSESLSGKNSDRIWFHCASLGEFEQGRPLIEKIKADSPTTCIVLSFFSPSGYEIRKNYPLADVVCYLPIDSSRNAKKFIALVAPRKAFFVKYEFWVNYMSFLAESEIPLYLVSAIFRPGQLFFKWYGALFRNALIKAGHLFVQDENSKLLLGSIGIHNVTVAGDTRFDRVYEIASSRKPVPPVERFKNNRDLIVAGSTWKEDEDILFDALASTGLNDIGIVIAPHEVNEKRVKEIVDAISTRWPDERVVTYSSGHCDGSEKFFILDTIGLLSSVYYYGKIAWVGGGFGKGIHNILEAAVYCPVLFGPNYKKFREAVELTELKGAFSIKENAADILRELLNDSGRYLDARNAGLEYVNSNRGATRIILEHTGISMQKVRE